MNRAEIEDKVREFLIEDLEVEEDVIAPEAKLKDDLGIDSLDFVDWSSLKGNSVLKSSRKRWPG